MSVVEHNAVSERPSYRALSTIQQRGEADLWWQAAHAPEQVVHRLSSEGAWPLRTTMLDP